MTTSSTSPPSFADPGVPAPGAVRLGATPVRAWWSGLAAGDQRGLGSVPAPRPVPAGLPVHRLRQVHGAGVVVVGAEVRGRERWRGGADGRGPEADAVVAAGPGSCVAVLTADCAPVALGSPEGVHGAVHVGWRGLVAGVIGEAVSAMRALGAGTVVAGLGPTIHPCCYAFGPDHLETVAAVAGPGVRARTSSGEPALDLPAAVLSRLAEAQAQVVVDVDRCTACGGDAFSHRARGDEARQALFVWSEA